VPYALGSETSGSILTPAAFCGVTGLRPTYGLVSRAGAMALSWTLDKIGPLARTAEDCGIILEAIAGGDSGDPMSAGKGFFYAPQFAKPFTEMTIGYSPVDWEEWADPDLRPALKEALAVVKSLGVKLKEVDLPDFPYGPMVTTIIQAEAASIFEDLVASGQVDQLADERQIAGLKASQEVLAKDYLKAMRIRRQVLEAFGSFFYEMDMVIAPARTGVAIPISTPLDAMRAAALGTNAPQRRRGLNSHIAAGNLAGLPALSLPAGFAGKLPVAIALMGRAFTENGLLAVGKAFQERTNWHTRRPGPV
jgi:aspartyl-tRNA(Asn)/glutamyl-tRNA(Gln) amidotransferase subunit A